MKMESSLALLLAYSLTSRWEEAQKANSSTLSRLINSTQQLLKTKTNMPHSRWTLTSSWVLLILRNIGNMRVLWQLPVAMRVLDGSFLMTFSLSLRHNLISSPKTGPMTLTSVKEKETTELFNLFLNALFITTWENSLPPSQLELPLLPLPPFSETYIYFYCRFKRNHF